MPARAAREPTSLFRRLERVMVGFVMSVMAFVLERMVLRSLRKEGKTDPQPGTTITSKGGEIDIDP